MITKRRIGTVFDEAQTSCPSREEFFATGRDACSFLERFGFAEVSVPACRQGNPFQLWYRAADRFVVLIGEGWGTSASLWFETADGRRASYHDFVPRDQRKLSVPEGDQLALVRAIVGQAAVFGQEYLAGDLSSYNKIAQALPPHVGAVGDA